jgi:thioredoxin-related protein
MINNNFRASRRHFLVTAGIGLAAANATSAWAAGAVLPAPQSLQDELGKAVEKGNPLVVMVSLEGCPFCRVARDSYLEPLRRQEGMPVFQIDMRSASAVRDFGGASVTHDQLVQAWRITIAPTVLFFGPRGKEIVARMEGGYIPDFYGAYLDQRMEQARALIKTARPG